MSLFVNHNVLDAGTNRGAPATLDFTFDPAHMK